MPRRFVETAVELAEMGFAVVGILAPRIVMVHEHAKPCDVAGGGPLEHLEIVIQIAEGCNRAPANVLVDAKSSP